jgi:hypothetical protein
MTTGSAAGAADRDLGADETGRLAKRDSCVLESLRAVLDSMCWMQQGKRRCPAPAAAMQSSCQTV